MPPLFSPTHRTAHQGDKESEQDGTGWVGGAGGEGAWWPPASCNYSYLFHLTAGRRCHHWDQTCGKALFKFFLLSQTQ